MTPTDTGKTALVLSGGGAYGAYEVGAVQALALGLSSISEYQPFEPDIITGTSAGAYNATFLASQGHLPFTEAGQRLQYVWHRKIAQRADRWGNGVFRYRLDPSRFLNPLVLARSPHKTLRRVWKDSAFLTAVLFNGASRFLRARGQDLGTRLSSLIDLSAFISLGPLEHTLRSTIDYENLKQSPKYLAIAATKWEIGQLLVASKQQMATPLGPKLAKGSASIPGIFPPEWVDSAPLVDGGVLLNSPIEPAIEAGASKICVISLSPRIQQIPIMFTSTVGAMNRAQLTSWKHRLGADLRKARLINEALTVPEDRPSSKQQLAGCAGLVLKNLDKRYRLLEIHVIRPTQYLGGGPLGILDFSQRQIRDNGRLGFFDAKQHNCMEEGCVLPGRPKTPPDQSMEAL